MLTRRNMKKALDPFSIEGHETIRYFFFGRVGDMLIAQLKKMLLLSGSQEVAHVRPALHREIANLHTGGFNVSWLSLGGVTGYDTFPGKTCRKHVVGFPLKRPGARHVRHALF